MIKVKAKWNNGWIAQKKETKELEVALNKLQNEIDIEKIRIKVCKTKHPANYRQLHRLQSKLRDLQDEMDMIVSLNKRDFEVTYVDAD